VAFDIRPYRYVKVGLSRTIAISYRCVTRLCNSEIDANLKHDVSLMLESRRQWKDPDSIALLLCGYNEQLYSWRNQRHFSAPG